MQTPLSPPLSPPPPPSISCCLLDCNIATQITYKHLHHEGPARAKAFDSTAKDVLITVMDLLLGCNIPLELPLGALLSIGSE